MAISLDIPLSRGHRCRYVYHCYVKNVVHPFGQGERLFPENIQLSGMGRYLVAEIDEDAFQHEEGQTADIGFFRPSDQIWSKHKDIIFKAIAVQADVVGNGVHTVYGDVFPEPERFRD